MTYSLRKIEEKDYPDLISLFNEFALFGRLPDKMTNSVEQMKSESDLINGFVAVSEDNNIVGYVTYFYAYYTWIGKSMHMDDLYVKEDFRGQGLGKELINKVIGQAKFDKCKKLHWQVSKWNRPAIGFYKSLSATIDDVELNCDLEF